jgi:2-keto-4-pentenoate hydratase
MANKISDRILFDPTGRQSRLFDHGESSLKDPDISAAARHLLDARRSLVRIEGLAESLLPETREVAYAIQDRLIEISEERIGGWKIAAGTGPDPLCAPIPAGAYRDSGDTLGVAGAMATLVEAEVAVRFGRDLPPRDEPYETREVAAAIAALHPSLEILGTRFSPALEVPRLTVIADLQNNSAVATGPAREDWQDLDLSLLGIRLSIGESVSRIETGPSAAELLEALTWLANGRAHDYGGFKAGQVVITGSRVNAPVGLPGEIVRADFDGFGSVSLRLV